MARAGFTITELIVSIGVLVMLIGMVTVVFSSSSRATRMAQSSSAAHREIRNVVSTLRRDLGNVDPNTGLMCIVGTKIFAYHTPTDAASKRPLDPNASGPDSHRADLLMVFTNRKLESFVAPGTPVLEPAMVVYGHADSGKLVYTSGWTFDPLQTRPIEESVFGSQFVNVTTPASNWHLARRTTLFPPTTGGFPEPTHGLADASLQECTGDIYTEVCAADMLGRLPNSFVPGGRFLRDTGGNWYLYRDGIAYKKPTSSSNWHMCSIAGNTFAYDSPAWADTCDDVDIGVPAATPETALLMFYDVPGATHRRTLIDPSPPPEEASRLAHYFLPRCSWFHVEYTYDDPRELLYDGSGSGIPITAPIRWHSVEPGEQVWWAKLPARPQQESDPNRWPRALRITFTIYPGGGENAEPMSHTLIHTW